jgi:hypothetical protein
VVCQRGAIRYTIPQPHQYSETHRPVYHGSTVREYYPFLHVLVNGTGTALPTEVYRKPSYTASYRNYERNHTPVLKVVQNLYNKTNNVCQKRQDFLQ